MCLRYYSRMRLAHDLLPLLLRADRPRIVSIFAAGHEVNFYPEDLSLRSHYGLINNVSHVVFMTTFFFEALVAQNMKISCLHVFPGLVKTAEFENGLFPGWLKWSFKWIMLPLITPWCISVEECGERNLYHSTSERYPARDRHGTATTTTKHGSTEVVVGVDGTFGSGVYAVSSSGESIRRREGVYEQLRKKDMGKVVWEHTMDAFKAVEEGRVFQG